MKVSTERRDTELQQRIHSLEFSAHLHDWDADSALRRLKRHKPWNCYFGNFDMHAHRTSDKGHEHRNPAPPNDKTKAVYRMATNWCTIRSLRTHPTKQSWSLWSGTRYPIHDTTTFRGALWIHGLQWIPTPANVGWHIWCDGTWSQRATINTTSRAHPWNGIGWDKTKRASSQIPWEITSVVWIYINVTFGNTPWILQGTDCMHRHELNSKQAELIELHLALINYALERGTTYKRWQTIANSIIFKDPDTTKLHRIRVIHICEADYNLVLGRVKWRSAMQRAEEMQVLNEGQYGWRNSRRATDPVFIKELQLEISPASRKPFVLIN